MRAIYLVGLLFACVLFLPGRSFAQGQAWRYRASAQAGGTLLLGKVVHEVDGERIHSTAGKADDDLYAAIDTRGSISALWKRSFALTAQLGWSNWQSGYMRMAGHDRSNYFGLGISPELRLPLGTCRRCPALYAAPKAGAVLSLRDQRSLRASADEDGRVGSGYFWGFRAGMDLTFHPRFGLKVETGYEQAWLRHRVHYEGAGAETQTFTVSRPVTMVGVWWGL